MHVTYCKSCKYVSNTSVKPEWVGSKHCTVVDGKFATPVAGVQLEIIVVGVKKVRG